MLKRILEMFGPWRPRLAESVDEASVRAYFSLGKSQRDVPVAIVKQLQSEILREMSMVPAKDAMHLARLQGELMACWRIGMMFDAGERQAQKMLKAGGSENV